MAGGWYVRRHAREVLNIMGFNATEDRLPAVGPGVFYHVGIATRDVDEAMASLGALFGLSWSESERVDRMALAAADGPVDWRVRRAAFSRGGPMRIELLQGDVGSVWHTTQEAELHHVAYWVDDLALAIEAMAAAGWTRETTTLDAGGMPIRFAYMTKPGNARIELADAADRDVMLQRLGWAQWGPYLH